MVSAVDFNRAFITNDVRNVLSGVVLVANVMNNMKRADKTFEETEMREAFVVSASGKGYTFEKTDDRPERIYRSFIAATSAFLGINKVPKEDEATAMVLTDINGNFKFGAIVEYHNSNSEDPDDPDNWTYVMTFNEEDIDSLASKKKLNKFLYGDEKFKVLYNKVAYDIGGIQFVNDVYMYDSCLLAIDTLVGVLDREAVEGEDVDIELPGYFVATVAVEDGEKVFSIVPQGSMKELIKGDLDITE